MTPRLDRLRLIRTTAKDEQQIMKGDAVNADRFDLLVKALSDSGTRRRLLRLVALIPLSGGLAISLQESEADRRHRHQADRGKHSRRARADGKGRKKRKKKNKKKSVCQPESPAQTCAGRCGTQTN